MLCLYCIKLIVIINSFCEGLAAMMYTDNREYRYDPHISWCKTLRWKIPPSPDTVALASFPGSGNTWLRYLLQQVTGVATGSYFTDYALQNNGFPAENVTNGSVLVVKTHLPPPTDNFTSAILLIRHPRDAILANFNMVHRGHLGSVSKKFFTKADNFLTPKGIKTEAIEDWESWSIHVPIKLKKWEKFYQQWLLQFPGHLYIVLYEELVRDTKDTLYGILGFLNHTVTEVDMTCALINREGVYRRKKRKHYRYDPFTSQMKRELERGRKRVKDLVVDYQRMQDIDRQRGL